MKFAEEKIESQIIYEGKILKLQVDKVRLPDGRVSSRECVRHNGGAAVLLVRDSEILLVRQFRYLYGKEIYEIPAGKLDGSEQPEKGAARELEEETGYKAELVPFLKIYPTPGYTDEIIHVFFAKSFEFVGARPDEGEFISYEFIPVTRVVGMIENGEICDAKTVAAVYKYLSLK